MNERMDGVLNAGILLNEWILLNERIVLEH